MGGAVLLDEAVEHGGDVLGAEARLGDHRQALAAEHIEHVERPEALPVAELVVRRAVPPQNLVDRAMIDVSALRGKLLYPDASRAVRPTHGHPIEPEVAA